MVPFSQFLFKKQSGTVIPMYEKEDALGELLQGAFLAHVTFQSAPNCELCRCVGMCIFIEGVESTIKKKKQQKQHVTKS